MIRRLFVWTIFLSVLFLMWGQKVSAQVCQTGPVDINPTIQSVGYDGNGNPNSEVVSVGTTIGTPPQGETCTLGAPPSAQTCTITMSRLITDNTTGQQWTGNVTWTAKLVSTNPNNSLTVDLKYGIQCPLSGLIWHKEFLLKMIPFETFVRVDSWNAGYTAANVETWCYNCCVPAVQGCPNPLGITNKVYFAGDPLHLPTFFYVLGIAVSSNFLAPGWHVTPGLDLPYYYSILDPKQYCTPYVDPPY